MIKDHYEVIRENKIAFWWFKGRRDIFLSILNRFCEKKDGFGIDLGCGPLTNEILYDKFASHWISLDYSIYSFKDSKNSNASQKIVGNLLKLPVKPNSIDLAFLLDVLEHIEDDNLVLAKINKILKNGAVLLISLPSFNILWSYHDEQAGHKRRYRKKDLINLAKGCGFEIVYLTYFNATFFLPILLIRKVLRVIKGGEKKLEIDLSPKFLDPIFYFLIKIENLINLFLFKMPFGTSVVGLLRKKDDR